MIDRLDPSECARSVALKTIDSSIQVMAVESRVLQNLDGSMKLNQFKALTDDIYGMLVRWNTGTAASLRKQTDRLPQTLARDRILEATPSMNQRRSGSPRQEAARCFHVRPQEPDLHRGQAPGAPRLEGRPRGDHGNRPRSRVPDPYADSPRGGMRGARNRGLRTAPGRPHRPGPWPARWTARLPARQDGQVPSLNKRRKINGLWMIFSRVPAKSRESRAGSCVAPNWNLHRVLASGFSSALRKRRRSPCENSVAGKTELSGHVGFQRHSLAGWTVPKPRYRNIGGLASTQAPSLSAESTAACTAAIDLRPSDAVGRLSRIRPRIVAARST